MLRTAGPGFYCGTGSFFRPNESIVIGRNVFIGNGAHIAAPCEIRDDVMLAARVAFVGGDHAYDRAGVALRSAGRGPMPTIIVDEDAWIGYGAILLAGVRVGRGAIVAAGSVVTAAVPPCEIWGGNPARRIKSRFRTAADLDLHLAYLMERYGPPKTVGGSGF